MSILRQRIEEKAAKGRGLPISGVIALGSKRMTKDAKANQNIVKLYNSYKAGEITSKEAEKRSSEFGVRYPFFPVNTEEFNLHPLSMEGGRATVNYVLEQYGEERVKGEGKKLYRFPVLFPDVPNGIEGVFVSKFAVPQGPTKFWSEYGDDGERYCMYREPVDPAKQAQRKKFLPRNSAIRGKCDPGSCPEFAQAQCRFEGTLHFYVPGVTGAGTIIIKTGSASSAEDVYLRLDDLYKRCRGRLPNYTPDGQPVFWLSKVKKSKPFFDADGVERISEQWVLSLETIIDMSKVLMIEERRLLQLETSSARPKVPSAWAGGNMASTTGFSQAPEAVVGGVPQGSPNSNSGYGGNAVDEKLIDELTELCTKNDIDSEVDEWAEKKFGDDWMEDAIKMSSVISEVRALLGHMNSAKLKIFLPLATKLYSIERLDVRVGMKYLSRKFTGFRDIESLQQASNHLDKLLLNSNDVVLKEMTAESSS